MDIFVGLVFGFLAGIVFTIYMTRIIAGQVVDIIFSKTDKSKPEETEDDAANFWKPKGWKPDS